MTKFSLVTANGLVELLPHGTNIMNALDLREAAEFSANSLIDTTVLGALFPLACGNPRFGSRVFIDVTGWA